MNNKRLPFISLSKINGEIGNKSKFDDLVNI